MKYSTIVCTAFIALVQITAIPIIVDVDDRAFSFLSGNDNNGAVLLSGNGGNGGTNIAVPIALSEASSKSYKSGKTYTTSSAGNEVLQSADGGSGYAVGTFGSYNKIHSRDGSLVSIGSILSDNDNNGFVLLSGNGGAGGTNVAIPIALSSSSSSSKADFGKIITASGAGNAVGQSANGGSGYAIGTYGSWNKLGHRGWSGYSFGSNNDNNGVVIGSGNGGNGGTNLAVPVAISSASSKNGFTFGKIVTTSSAGNDVYQSADGGSGSAVGSFGSHNHISRDVEDRGYGGYSFLSGNDNNGLVVGSGNGGNGGTNLAVPIALSSASSSSGFTKGKLVTSSSAGNYVEQSANGGSGSAVGSFGSKNWISRGYKSVLSNNDNNGVVVGSGNGGNGGLNFALPIAASSADSKSGFTFGKVITASEAANAVSQSANGGSGSAIGTFGSHNYISREAEPDAEVMVN